MALKLAFCIFKYFPFGGLQRMCLQLAQACAQNGHQVDIYTLSWQGPYPENINVIIVPTRGLSNHQQYQNFADYIGINVRYTVDAIIGFNKMPHLDIYYSADPCFIDKVHRNKAFFYRMTPRFRHFYEFEQAVFGIESSTIILLHAEVEKKHFQHYYHTPENRFILLPPGISRDCMYPIDAQNIRAQYRADLELQEQQKLILMVGSGFKTKGVDRALLAFHALPTQLRDQCRLVIIGQDNAKPFIRLAKKLQIDRSVQFFNGRNDIPNFLLAADLLLHPAYRENAGMILLEAIVAGLPVLVTAVCGYAHYIDEAQAGLVLPEPFDQNKLNKNLALMLTSSLISHWQQNGIAFGRENDLYSQIPVTVDTIEQLVMLKTPTAVYA